MIFILENRASDALKKMKQIQKKNGYVLIDVDGKEVSVDLSDTDGVYVYGLDNFDNEYEINLEKDNYKILEADGSVGDLGAAPSDANPTQGGLKLLKNDVPGMGKDKAKKRQQYVKMILGKDTSEAVVADRDIKHKKLAAKIAKAKKDAKCTGNKTPERVKTSGSKIKFKCTVKDPKLSRIAKKTAKANKTARKKGAKSAQKTKEFRKK